MTASLRRPKAFFFDNSLWSLFHFRRAVIQSMLDAGWEIIILCPIESIEPIHRISGCRYVELDVERTTTSIWQVLKTTMLFHEHVRRERPDIVFAYTLKPILISGIANLFTKFHTVMVFAGLGQLLNLSGLKAMLAKAATRLALLTARKVILSNRDDLSYFSLPYFFSHSSFIVLPYGEGVDTTRYSPAQNHEVSPRSISFLMIGRLLEEKGVLQFIESARTIKLEFPDARFVLCGYLDTNHPNAIPKTVIDQACQDGLIEFIGTVQDTRLYLDQSRCFVMPSFYNEGMNRSIMDALAMGVPVITTNNRGCRELVQDGRTGFIVQPRSVSELCDKMRSVLVMDEPVWAAMSHEARLFAKEHLDDSCVATIYRKVVREILPSDW
jgi:glycosyltransferase involved in cell wall biosynthesis